MNFLTSLKTKINSIQKTNSSKKELIRKENLKKLAEIAKNKPKKHDIFEKVTFNTAEPKIKTSMDNIYRNVKPNHNFDPVEYVKDINKQVRLGILREQGISAYFDYLLKRK